MLFYKVNMNLLPKTQEEFGEADYWDSFFRKRGKEAFEWYGDYTELCDVLHKYIRPQDDILEVGCGNSELAARLHSAGCTRTTSIDISAVAVRQVRQKHPQLCCLQMDATAMSFADGNFSVMLDKGTVDALTPRGSDGTAGARLCAEAWRVLRPGGRLICVSLLQEHVLRLLLEWLAGGGWLVRVVRCPGGSGPLPVFAVVATRLATPESRPVLEICLGGERVERAPDTAALRAAIRAVQRAALACDALQRRALDDGAALSFELEDAASGGTRYSVHVVERAGTAQRTYAAFIVPQGRELEWLFGSDSGRRQLAVSADCRRLAVVTMHRGQSYASLDAVKIELAEVVRSFAPAGLRGPIPFLSVGDEEDVGACETRHSGHSSFSGDFVVEDYKRHGRIYRRLVFLSSQNVVQSEVRLRPDGSVDALHLACRHHVAMSVGCGAAVAGAPQGRVPRALVVGLGGGGLCSFLVRCVPRVALTAVELDAVMRDVAVQWFGLVVGDRLRIQVADGLEYMAAEAARGSQFDVILLDVDSKEARVGLSCPPRAFLEPATLESARALMRTAGEHALLVVNVVARDAAMRAWALRELTAEFDVVASYRVPDELNEVVFCGAGELEPRLKSAARALTAETRRQAPHRRRDRRPPTPLLDADEFSRALIKQTGEE